MATILERYYGRAPLDNARAQQPTQKPEFDTFRRGSEYQRTDVSIEQWLLEVNKTESLADIPTDVARQVIALDTLNFQRGLKDRIALLAFMLYVSDGKFGRIKTYLKIREYGVIDSMINSVIEDDGEEGLANDYDKASGLEAVLRSILPSPTKDNGQRDWWKATAREVARLKAEGMENEQIVEMKTEIRERTRPKSAIKLPD